MKYPIIVTFSLLIMSCCTRHSTAINEDYIEIKAKILYTNKKKDIFLKHKALIPARDGNDNVTENYFSDVYYKNKIYPLSKIIDTRSFENISQDHFDNFYRDKNFIYSFRDLPACYPNLFVIDINKSNYKIAENYIFDYKNVFWLDYKLDGVNVKEFHTMKQLNIGMDNKNIFIADKAIDYYDFDQRIDNGYTKDSLKEIYFPNEKP